MPNSRITLGRGLLLLTLLALVLPALAAGPDLPYTRSIGAGVISHPRGTAVDRDGNLYVADIGSEQIHKFDADGNLLMTFAGPGNGPGQFANLATVNLHPARNELYGLDNSGHRIGVFDLQGNFLRAFGWGVFDGSAEFQVCVAVCQIGLSGSGAGQMSFPTDMAFDADGNLFVDNQGDNFMAMFDEDDNHVRNFGIFDGGEQMAIHPISGLLYVHARSGIPRTIRVMDSFGVEQFDFPVQSDMTGLGIAPDGNVWITRPTAGAGEIRDANGNFLAAIDDDGNFGQPADITFGPGGAAFISDRGTDSVHQFGEENLVQCAVDVAERVLTFGADRTAATINVETNVDECPWVVMTDVDWIRRISPRDGIGDEAVDFVVLSNETGKRRAGRIFVDRNRVRVVQEPEDAGGGGGGDNGDDALEAPRRFRVETRNSRALDLSWKDRSRGEASFRLVAVDKTSGDRQRFDLPPGTEDFRHTGLDADTRYCYRLRAIGADGFSDWVRRCGETR